VQDVKQNIRTQKRQRHGPETGKEGDKGNGTEEPRGPEDNKRNTSSPPRETSLKLKRTKKKGKKRRDLAPKLKGAKIGGTVPSLPLSKRYHDAHSRGAKEKGTAGEETTT